MTKVTKVAGILFAMRLVKWPCIAAILVNCFVTILGFTLGLWPYESAIEAVVIVLVGGPLAFGMLYVVLILILNVRLNAAMIGHWKAQQSIQEWAVKLEVRAWCNQFKALHWLLCRGAGTDLAQVIEVVCPLDGNGARTGSVELRNCVSEDSSMEPHAKGGNGKRWSNDASM